jgi:hypothetical protein
MLRKKRVPWRKTMQRWSFGVAILVTAGFVMFSFYGEIETPDASISSAAPVYVNYTGSVLPDRPLVIHNSPGDITVYVPCCSLGIGGEVTLSEEEPDHLSEPERLKVWYRPRVISLQYTTSGGEIVHNAYSSTPLEVCFVLNDMQWRAYQEYPEDYEIQYYDDIHRPYQWRRTAIYEMESRHSLCIETNRIRTYGLAVRGEEIPITGGGNNP